MPTPPALEHPIGRHTCAFEPPAIVSFTMRGDLSPAEMDEIAALLIARVSGMPDMLVLVSLGDLGDVPAETRKIARRALPHLPLRGIAYHGGSFHKRLLIKLVLGAVQLLAPNPDLPVRFFDAEADARAWLAERERELSAG